MLAIPLLLADGPGVPSCAVEDKLNTRRSAAKHVPNARVGRPVLIMLLHRIAKALGLWGGYRSGASLDPAPSFCPVLASVTDRALP